MIRKLNSGRGGFFLLRKYALGVFKIDKQFLYILEGGDDSNMRNNSTHKLYHKLLLCILCKHYNKVIYPVVDYYYIKYVFWVWAKSIIPNNFPDFFWCFSPLICYWTKTTWTPVELSLSHFMLRAIFLFSTSKKRSSDQCVIRDNAP